MFISSVIMQADRISGILALPLIHVASPFINIPQYCFFNSFDFLLILHYLCFVLDLYSTLTIILQHNWEAFIVMQSML